MKWPRQSTWPARWPCGVRNRPCASWAPTGIPPNTLWPGITGISPRTSSSRDRPISASLLLPMIGWATGKPIANWCPHKWLICPISVSGSNFNPQNTSSIPAVKIFAFLELEQIISFMAGHQWIKIKKIGYPKEFVMEYENLVVDKKDNICIITINRPPANSWSLAAIEEFEKILEQIEDDKDIRVVVLTGAGEKCFSAGMDVADAGKSPHIGAKGREVWRRVDRFEKPIIAAINGHALGGGLELALSAHFRIMMDSPKAKIGLTELNLGIIPGWGGTQRMPRVLGKSKALELILFSKRLTAQEALEVGLVNQVSKSGELMQDVTEMAEFLAKRPPLAVQAVLKAVNVGLEHGIDEGTKAEWEGTQTVSKSKDAIEGFTAFMEKREPQFKGE